MPSLSTAITPWWTRIPGLRRRFRTVSRQRRSVGGCNRITRLHTVSTTPTARSQPSLSTSLHTHTRQSRLISKISVEDEATRNQLKNYNDDQDSKGASTKTRWLYLLDTITTAYLPTIEYRHSNRKKCRKTAVRR